MSLLRECVHRLGGTFRRGRSDGDLHEELCVHAEMSSEAARRTGQPAETATRAAVLRHGRVMQALEAQQDQRGLLWLADLDGDVRHAVRQAVRHPGATAVSVLTVALGITVTTILFSLAYGVLLRPLPWPDAGRLVRVSETRRDATRALPFVSNVTYNAWNDRPSTIEYLAGYRERTFVLDRRGSLEQVQGVLVTPNVFPMLQASPLVGRVFETRDQDAVLVSVRFARSRFSDSAAAIGKRLQLAGAMATIVGVMPDDFAFPNPSVDLWVPFAVRPTKQEGLTIFSAVARLRPDVTVQQATEEATARGRSAPDPGLVAIGMFGGSGPVEVRLEPWLDSLTGQVKPGLLVLLVGVVLLLLAAVGSLANLHLVRAAGRQRELAIRASLGAGRLRIARELLVEPILVAVVGGAVGLLLTGWFHRLLPLWMPSDFPRLEAVSFGPMIVAFGVVLTLVTGLLVGAVPAGQTKWINLVSALREDGWAPVGHSWRSKIARARALVIIAQIAVTVLLLVGAGLLGRSLLHLATLDHGYDPNNLVAGRIVSVTGRIISTVQGTPRTAVPGLAELVTRLTALPGVLGVAVANALPLPSTGEGMVGMKFDTDKDHPTPVQIQAKLRTVSAGYFDTLVMRVVTGRGFDASDANRQGPTPLVVNETFARHYLPAERPLGQLGRRSDGTPFYEVVGVVGDVPLPTGAPAEPEMFVPFRDLDRATGQPVLFVRTIGDPVPFIATIRQLTREVSPLLGFDGAVTMDVRLADTNARPRLFAVVASLLAGFALLIAVVGLFGVLSYTVAQRRREIGITSALGATPGRIVRIVVGQGLSLAVAGVVVGLAAAGLLARSVSSLLYGVTPFDPLTFVAVPLVVLAAAGLACFLPARRAARIDPWQALRQG
jgi:putative ABC transport system permease protein